MSEVRFIRKNGRVIPIRAGSAHKTRGQSAKVGAKRGAKIGAGIGAVAGAITMFTGGGPQHIALGALRAGVVGTGLGAGIGAASFRKKK